MKLDRICVFKCKVGRIFFSSLKFFFQDSDTSCEIVEIFAQLIKMSKLIFKRGLNFVHTKLVSKISDYNGNAVCERLFLEINERLCLLYFMTCHTHSLRKK